MEINFQFLDVKNRIICDSSYSFGCWKWKLDAYLISLKSMKFLPNLTIDFLNDKLEAAFLDRNSLLQDKLSGFFRHQVWRLSNGSTKWSYVRNHSSKEYLCFHVTSNWDRITLITDQTGTAGEIAFEYLGMIMPSVMLNYDILNFHGVLMEHQGKGIIISANSGTGKTTHARLWRDVKNALIINGDRATCKKVDGVWTGYGLPWSGTSGEQINRHVPLKALVVLERGTENEAHVLSLEEKLQYVLPHVLYPSWDGELVGKMMDLLDEFLSDIPIIRLRCRPDTESVEVLNEILEEIK